MKILHFVVAFLRASLLSVSVYYFCGMLLELLSHRKSPSRTFNYRYTVFFQFFDITVVYLFTYFLTAEISKLPFHGLIPIPIKDHGIAPVGILLAVGSVAVIRDFFYYWFHRWQHRSKWLWAEHSVHHSDESMNVTTALRHHWLENLLHTLFVAVPSMILFKPPVVTVAIASTVVGSLGYFIHLNAPISLGAVFASPATHRIHHSRLPEHIDKNFAAVLPLWDVLFGTYYSPQRNECPPTGLSSGERIVTMREAISWPFRKWAWMLSGGRASVKNDTD